MSNLKLKDLEQNLNKYKGTTLTLDSIQIEHSDINTVVQFLVENKVTVLQFEETQIDDQVATELAKRLKDTDVHTLRLSYEAPYETCQVAHGLVNGLKGTNVSTLDLTLCHIGTTNAISLTKRLAGTNVYTLNLAWNSISSNGIEDLAKHLKDTNIRTLGLAGNCMEQGHNNNLDAGRLAAQLKGTSLHTLDLRSSFISDQIAEELINRLKGTNVHTLKLAGNFITDRGAERLAAQLNGSNLHTLDLGNNSITDRGAKDLAKALMGSSVVRVIGIEDPDLRATLEANNRKRQAWYAVIGNSLTRYSKMRGFGGELLCRIVQWDPRVALSPTVTDLPFSQSLKPVSGYDTEGALSVINFYQKAVQKMEQEMEHELERKKERMCSDAPRLRRYKGAFFSESLTHTINPEASRITNGVR